MKHWESRLGVALLLLAVAPYVYVQYRLRSHNWTPIDAPTALQDGTVQSTAVFSTDLTGFYKVSLTFAPNNVEHEECLIGDRHSASSCVNTQDGLQVDWSVLRENSDGESVVVGNRPYYPAWFEGAGNVATVLGGFESHKGDRYRVALHVRKVAPELQAATPHIKVEALQTYWEQWVIFAQISLLFGMVIGILAIWLLILGFVGRSRVAIENG
jgi:hypothetical protein